jgi:di/tricarboxylate transporter
MRLVWQILSWTALAATIVPSVLYLAGQIGLDDARLAMLVATIVWFATAPLWMGRPAVDEELVI